MKTKTYLIFAAVVLGLVFSSVAHSQTYKSKYVQDNEERSLEGIHTGFRQIETEALPTGTMSPNDPHVKIIGWDPAVPLPRFINNIKEGETNQLAVLRMLSAPNIMWRDPVTEREKWVYHWIWSYANEYDPNETIIYMNHSGKKLKNNKKPVVMVINFNEKDIVEGYQIRLLKVRRDAFDEY